MMTYREYFDYGVKAFSDAGLDDAEFESRELLEHIFGLSRTDFILKSGEIPENDKAEEFTAAVSERVKGKPLQYIIGEWDFYNLTFKVGEGVLIPRPETELLTDYILKYIESSSDDTVGVLDLCAGSGCIGISVAENSGRCRVCEIEKSDDAFKYLLENIEFNNAKTVTALKGDVFSGYKHFEADILKALGGVTPKVIVSNPPYICSSEIGTLQREVLSEPKMALDGGVDGLDFYRVIAEKWLPFIPSGGVLITECGEEQSEEIEKIYSRYSAETFKIRDFAGIYRVVGAKIE